MQSSSKEFEISATNSSYIRSNNHVRIDMFEHYCFTKLNNRFNHRACNRDTNGLHFRKRCTMTKSAVVRARVEPTLKAKAEKILDRIGLTPSDAVRIFYKQIVARKALPLDLMNPQDSEKAE